MGSKQSSSPPTPTAKPPPPTPTAKPPLPQSPLLPSPPQKPSSSTTTTTITSSLSEIHKPLLEKSLLSAQLKGLSVNLDQLTKSRKQETSSSPNQEPNVADGSSCSSLRLHSSMGLKISSSPAPPPFPPPTTAAKPPPTTSTAKPLPPAAILPIPTLQQSPLLPSPPQKPSSSTTTTTITSSLSEIRKPLLEKSLPSDQVKGLPANLYQLSKSGKQDTSSSPNQEPNVADGSSCSSFHDHSSMSLKLSSSPPLPNAAADPSGRKCTTILRKDINGLKLKVDEADKEIELLQRKVENDSNDKKREVAFALMLLAYTIFGGYNVAVYTSGNCNMMPYQFTAMVISLIGVITFGWTALMTVGFKAENASEGLSQPTRIMRWFYFQSLNAVPIIAALVAVSFYISFLYCAYSTSCAKEQQNISGDNFCAFVRHYI